MKKSNDLSESVIFPKGGKITDGHFIGVAWVETPVPMDSTFNCQIANVTFEPGGEQEIIGISIQAGKFCLLSEALDTIKKRANRHKLFGKET